MPFYSFRNICRGSLSAILTSVYLSLLLVLSCSVLGRFELVVPEFFISYVFTL